VCVCLFVCLRVCVRAYEREREKRERALGRRDNSLGASVEAI
jgi:hypothetical protein